jgi:hypothetical protein
MGLTAALSRGLWWGMKRLAPGRTFRDPGDLRGVPTVFRRRAIPRREEPLPGTRRFDFPKADLRGLWSSARSVRLAEVTRAASACGWVALALAVGSIVAFVVGMALELEGMAGAIGLQTAAVLMGLFGVNFFGTFSQILSDCRERRGSLAMLIVWSAAPFLVLVRLLMA